MGLLEQKLRAFALHLGISLLVLFPFLAFVYFVLYTPEVLHLEGGQWIVLIVFGLGLALGPMMTAFLYRKGKWGMRFDLIVVGLIQALAFVYGGWVLYSQRPVYLAFVKEHFEVIPSGSIDLTELRDQSLQPGMFSGPRMIFVEPPRGQDSQDILWQALTGGKDIQLLPAFYRPVDQNLEAMRARSIGLEKLRETHLPAVTAVGDALLRLGRTEDQIMLLPIIGRVAEGAVLLDRDSGDLLEYLDVMIW